MDGAVRIEVQVIMVLWRLLLLVGVVRPTMMVMGTTTAKMAARLMIE